MSRLSRWFWLRLLHAAPRDLVDLVGRVDDLDQSMRHLAYATERGLIQCQQREHTGVRPEDVFTEEWSQ